jgi:dihydropteroate synthase type 2
VKLLGILNLTRDSFSDGGRYLDPAAAMMHARRLVSDGADVIDVGAEATHPNAGLVPADEEIARLSPVVQALKSESVPISIDTRKPAVMRAMARFRVDYINDVDGFGDPESIAAVRDTTCSLIVMHRVREAEQADVTRAYAEDPASIVDRIVSFFIERRAVLVLEGIDETRLIFDPGMGLFLSPDPAVSLSVLREIGSLRLPGCRLLISTSRKSFIGATLGTVAGPRPVAQRSAGTLATELWAAFRGIDYIRTHEPRPLRDALSLWSHLDPIAGHASDSR